MLYSYSNQDTTTVSWETGSNKDRLVSCYMQVVKELVRNSEASRCLTILGCDSNLHHTLWGSTNINKRCEWLF